MEDYILWLGTQDSHLKCQTALRKSLSLTAEEQNNILADGQTLDDYIYEKNVSIQDGIAIISVTGSLREGSASWMAIYGVLGYDDLRNFIGRAIADAEVTGILLNVSSGGGSVAGVNDASDLIARAATIKPMVTYTGGMMASAAYWLGCQTGYIVANSTAQVGSLGVLMVHIEYSKQMEQEGVTATVIRSGADKALNTPYEPLSDRAKALMQEMADGMKTLFFKAVAPARNTTVADVTDNFGNGRMFLGAQAKSIGMVDQVGTFEDAYKKVQSMVKASAKAKPSVLTPKSGNVSASALAQTQIVADNSATTEVPQMPKPVAMTTEQLAAAAAGVVLPAASEGEGAGAPATAPAADPAPVAAPAAADPAPAAAAPATAAPATDAVALLKTMLTEANETIASLRVDGKTALDAATAKASALEAQLASANADLSSALKIVAASISTMAIPLGVTAAATEGMSATQILAEHARMSEQFTGKFKAGRVSAAKPETEQTNAAASAPNPMFVAAAQLNKSQRG